MKVLHIQKATGISGSERHLLDLLPALGQRGIETRLCVMLAGDGQRFVDAARARGIDTVTIPAGPDVNPVAVGRLRGLARRYGADLVHTHLIHADVHGLPAARLAGVPAVSSMHGTNEWHRREPFHTVAAAVGRIPRRTIAISHHVARFLRDRKLTPADRIRVIHYGINGDGWMQSDEQRAAARTTFGLAEGDVGVVVASRLIPHKGHDLLIDAAVQASAKVPGLRLLIAGTGPLRDELETRAAAADADGVVRFLGFVDDVVSMMNAADVVAFPSQPAFGEGFGLVNLEAMAAARPVLATGVDSVPEIVVDGQTGVLVPAGEVDGFTRALVELGADPERRQSMGRAGRTRMELEFNVAKMADATLAVYDEVLGGR